jgi:hypothetical protein
MLAVKQVSTGGAETRRTEELNSHGYLPPRLAYAKILLL